AGTPTHAGNYLMAVVVNDAAGNLLFRIYRLTIDNAAGEAPAVSLAPNPIQVNYLEGAPGGASIPVTVGATSGTNAFTLSVAGISGTSVFPASGPSGSVVALNIDAASLTANTYVGNLGMTASESANLTDVAPVVLNVLPLGSDTTPPSIGATPANIVVEATSPAGATVNFFTPVATDNFYPAPTLTVNPPSGSTFPVGTTLVTVTATDASALVSQKTFTVTVRDTIKPTASIATPQLGVVYTVGQFVLPSFSCSDIVHVASCVGPTPEGVAIDTGAPGTFTFTVTATDDAGNTSSVSTTYNVVGSAPQASVDFEVIHNFNYADGYAPTAPLIKGSDGNFYGTTDSGGQYGYGSVFKMNPSGAVTTLHSFDYTNDGAYPFAGLVQGSDGNFYGVTSYAGPGNYGTVFKVDAAGTLTTLHMFSANDGAQPFGTLVQGADGSFYGTANWGGPSGYGEIFKVDGAGAFAIVHAFAYGEGTYPLAGLTLSRDGYFYGTNQWGGAGYGTVYRADATGNLTVLHAFNYADGGRVWAGVTEGTDGFLYGTTYYGGSGGAGTVYKLDQTGASFATLHSFAGGDGGYPYGGVIQGPDGGLYGATSYGAPYYGTLFRVDATGAFTLLYPFDYYTGGAYPAATLYRDSDGRLYGTTQVGGSAGDGTAFRFALHLGAATGSSLVAASAVANFGGVAALTATLTSAGTPVGGRTVAFTINDAAVGSAVTNSSGVATLSNASLAGISAGTYPGAIRATFAGDVLIGAAVSAPSALVVEKGTPSIYWPAPNPIVEGTALDGTQLNASSDVAGSFVYTPAAGTVLGIGTGQMLSAVFTPADAVNYNLASADRFIDVLSASDVPERFEVLHRFEYADGENSFSALVEGPDHSFYGTTNWGGPSGYGAVFKIDPLTRAQTIVHAFDFSNEGAYPQAGLTLGADGYFYGTTSYGGPTYGGTVFKMDLAGALTVLHSFSSSTEGWYPTSPVVRDADGNLYGTTRYGGTGSAGTVFKLDPAG